MRSLKKDSNYSNISLILGLTVRYGKWYKITIRNEDKFWLAKFYGVSNDGNFLHMGNTYVVSPNYKRHYGCEEGSVYHPLCEIDEITDITMVSFEYVNNIIG